MVCPLGPAYGSAAFRRGWLIVFVDFPARGREDFLGLEDVFAHLVPLRLFLGRFILPPDDGTAEGAADIAHGVRASDELPRHRLVGACVWKRDALYMSGLVLVEAFVRYGRSGHEVCPSVATGEAFADDV